MPERRRTDTSDDPAAAYAAWMTEVTVGQERTDGRVQALEKSVDLNTAATKAVADALEHLARERSEGNRLQSEANKARAEWAHRIWNAPAVQLLLAGAVIALLNLLGVAYLAQRMQAFLPEPPSTGAVP